MRVTTCLLVSLMTLFCATYCSANLGGRPSTAAQSAVPKCRLDLVQQRRQRHMGWEDWGNDRHGQGQWNNYQYHSNNQGPWGIIGGTDKCPLTSAEYNKNFVLCFYDESFGRGQFSTAVAKYINPDKYIQHNPSAADGVAAFLAFAGPDASPPLTDPLDIRHVAADGDLVWIHLSDATSANPNPTTATVDIFRMECGKIVEHWDVIQPIVPPFANDHPFF